MMRFKSVSTALLSGTVMVLAGVLPIRHSQAETLTYPKTVQVKPGGASIFAQPRNSGEVIGEYKAGVILNPTLRVFSNEGQIWLKVGDHWIPEASLRVIEGPPPAAAQPPTPPASPPSPPPESPSKPSKPSTPATPSAPKGKPLAAPVTKTPRTAEVIAKDADVAINVREEPTTDSKSLLAVKSGEPAEVLKQTLGKDSYTWYKLKFTRLGAEGWMRGDFVKIRAQKSQPQSTAAPPKNPGAITSPPGVFVALQTTPAQQTATQYRASSGQSVELLKMVKGEDGLAWYNVQFLDNAEAKGWVRGDQVRWLVSYTQPKAAKLSASPGQIISFYAQPTEKTALPLRGISGQAVEVLKQTKGNNGYAWYSVKVQDKPTAQGWVKGENVRLQL
ncbi:SH3 domain-containing protein [Acaryochloris sp. CCMEE 5410]|uniref:SH3 domain-containing protein n=1 Tax=Acaryochloris sp. CCMEE 5410 TaxID=310037 RepID=UPI001F3D6659|nr:SH3 domain-containing protein [Acaryochloris sp. CCMEE 5410]